MGLSAIITSLQSTVYFQLGYSMVQYVTLKLPNVFLFVTKSST